jgi:hypothetical protein
MMQIVDCGFRIDERHKAQGTRRKEESAALIIRIPEGASFACDRRIYELRDCGLGRAGGIEKIKVSGFRFQCSGVSFRASFS